MATRRIPARTGVVDPVATLLEEAEAFLAGELAALWCARAEPVPAWAWLNALAHGSATSVHALVFATGARLHGVEQPWHDALAYLARVLTAVESTTGVELVALQRRVLVPLELDSLARPCATPDELVERTQQALRRSV